MPIVTQQRIDYSQFATKLEREAADYDKKIGDYTAVEAQWPAADANEWIYFAATNANLGAAQGDVWRCTTDGTAANTSANWELAPEFSSKDGEKNVGVYGVSEGQWPAADKGDWIFFTRNNPNLNAKVGEAWMCGTDGTPANTPANWAKNVAYSRHYRIEFDGAGQPRGDDLSDSIEANYIGAEHELGQEIAVSNVGGFPGEAIIMKLIQDTAGDNQWAEVLTA